MSGPTPGPWTVSHDKKHGQQRISANDAPIAVTKDEANARLIAAAPDLLAACKQMLAPPKKREDLLSDASAKRFAKIYKEMRAAIAKATGEQS